MIMEEQYKLKVLLPLGGVIVDSIVEMTVLYAQNMKNFLLHF